MSPDRAGPGHRAAFSGSPPLAPRPLPTHSPYSYLHAFAHLGPLCADFLPSLYPELNPTEAMAYFLALSLQVGAATCASAPPVWGGQGERDSPPHPGPEEGQGEIWEGRAQGLQLSCLLSRPA